MSHNRVLKYTLFAFATVGGIQSAHAQALQQQAAAPASNAAVISVPASTQALPGIRPPPFRARPTISNSKFKPIR